MAAAPTATAVRTATATVVPLDLSEAASARPWQRYRVDSQGSSWPQTDWSGYSNLRHPDRTPPVGGPLQYVIPVEGDPVRGQQLAFDRSRGGSCVVCHVMGRATPDQPGNVGPDLSQVGAGRTDDWLFNYVYDARLFNKASIMPPWGAHRVYNVAEIRDIVAFLKTLRTPHEIADPKENPNKRPFPVENRDNLDATENPGMFGIDTGKAAFRKPGPTGKACTTCHAAPEKAFSSWAARMPRYEPRLKKVMGVEEFITRHARATTGAELPAQTDANLGMSVYLRHLANGQPIAPDVTSPPARQAIARGERLMAAKLGQLHMSCNDCHRTHVNKWVRGQLLVQAKGTTAHFPTWRTSRGDTWDIRKRFQWCNVSVRANELEPEAAEYGDIELALAAINRGEKINAPGIRH